VRDSRFLTGIPSARTWPGQIRTNLEAEKRQLVLDTFRMLYIELPSQFDRSVPSLTKPERYRHATQFAVDRDGGIYPSRYWRGPACTSRG